MAAWAATAIRWAEPEGALCWAIESRCAAVTDTREVLTSRLEFDRDRWKSRRWSPATWRDQLRTYLAIRKQRFDFGFDLQGHSKTALCLRLAAPARRISVEGTDALARNLNPSAGPRPAGLHIVEWNHRVLNMLGEFELPERPTMPWHEAGWSETRKLLPQGKPLCSIATSAGAKDKTYPIELWRDVAARMIASGWNVVALGSTSDPVLGVEGAVDLVGKLPLASTMMVVASSQALLAADTGAWHIAAAYDVPVVSIFGPTDPAVYRPFTSDGIVLKGARSTSEVDPEDVVSAAGSLRRRHSAKISD